MPSSPEAYDGIAKILRRIGAAWRGGTPDRMAPMLSEEIVMIQPGDPPRIVGRAAVLESFENFVHEARIVSYDQGSLEVDTGDRVAVAQFAFEMVYERRGARWRSTGTELWVLEKRGADWVAVWRMLLGAAEAPAEA